MKKEIIICDWCERNKAIVVINKGEDKGDYLCKKCQEGFLEILRDNYLNDLEDGGDWRTAKIKLVKENLE
jgi:hypothetical protein